jgi:hypothetical protein
VETCREGCLVSNSVAVYYLVELTLYLSTKYGFMHKNSSLTLAQRKIVHDQVKVGVTKSELAKRFGVHPCTIARWASRDSFEDRPSGAKRGARVVTAEYREAVIKHRALHPDHGPITIAFHLRDRFAFANRGTILTILQQEGLTKPTAKDKPPKKVFQ